MEKEKRTEEAIQVFRKMLVEEFGIKSTEQFFSTEGEDMAVIYELSLIHISEPTRP